VGALAVVLSGSAPAGAEAVERALRSAPHRGGELAVRTLGRVSLGVANEPEFADAWVAGHDGTAVALQGALDNKEELDAELARAGRRPGDDDPGETVLAAFDAWGDEAPAQFRGMFAGAWTDGTTLRLFRDHLGLAPLHHREGGEAFVAATEAKQVVAGAGVPREPDVGSVEAMFFGRFDSRRTMLRGVARFPRASTAAVEPGREPVFRRYWDPAPLLETARLTLPEAREGLAEHVERAVRRTVTGLDAVSLSGGIDSPTIAAFAAPRHLDLTGRPLPALSSVYPDLPAVDESKWIELVVEHLGLELHTYRPSSRPLDDLAHWVDVLDGPVDTMSIPELAENYRLARELGARNVLSGEMAEWVFTFGQHLIGHLVLHGRVGASLAWMRDQRARGASWRRIARRAGPSLVSSRAGLAWLRLRGRTQAFRHLPDWVDAEAAGGPAERPDFARPARRRWLDHQLDPLVGVGSYSFDADAVCAAYHGVHVRRPLADVDLWEFVLTLPAEIKFPNALPKSLLRESVRGRLPDAILDRQDKTFFDDFALGTADYDGLRHWILETDVRLTGVDYALLAERIEARDMQVVELLWAYDLARAHAFLGLWT
jgi:asparagine synthase (glutamine-hydrolysing)